MKIKGVKISEPNVEVVVFPRTSGNIVFKAQAVLDYKDFDNLCPQPNPPSGMVPGGATKLDVTDPEYLKELDRWASQKTAWMVLESLKVTEDLEWETIEPSDPKTWEKWQDELQDAKFSPAEISRILIAVTTACGLNQEKIELATQQFLVTMGQEQENVSSPSTEQPNTQSGEPVKDSI